MSKTKEIEVSCSSVQVGHTSRNINVVLEEPNITEVLTAIDEDELGEYVRQNLAIENVYSQSDLEKWAESEGYVKDTQ